MRAGGDGLGCYDKLSYVLIKVLELRGDYFVHASVRALLSW